MKNDYYVYILANRAKGILYIGVKNYLKGRVWAHKNRIIKCFASKYNIDQLVYFEMFDDIDDAIGKEKILKRLEYILKSQTNREK